MLQYAKQIDHFGCGIVKNHETAETEWA